MILDPQVTMVTDHVMSPAQRPCPTDHVAEYDTSSEIDHENEIDGLFAIHVYRVSIKDWRKIHYPNEISYYDNYAGSNGKTIW